MSKVSSTSINDTTLISNSSWRRLLMRIALSHSARGGARGGPRWYRMARLRWRLGDLRNRRLMQRRELIQQRGRLLLHRNHITRHARTEIAMQHVGGNRDDQAGRGAHQRL